MYKRTVFSISLFITFICLSNAMTRSQMKQAGKVMRNVCQPRHKVTNEQVDNIKNGEFIDDKDVKCYIACVFTMAQSVKNGKINYDSTAKQIDLLMPEDMKGPAKKALSECMKVAVKYKELCESSFQFAQCLFETNRDVFVFP